MDYETLKLPVAARDLRTSVLKFPVVFLSTGALKATLK